MKLKILGLLALTMLMTAMTSFTPPTQAHSSFWAHGHVYYYGSIAYQWRTGRYGVSYSQRSRANADRNARQNALNRGVRGGGIRMFSVRNTCIAIFKDRRSTFFAWATHSSVQAAMDRARRRCERGGRRCQRKVWMCTGGQ